MKASHIPNTITSLRIVGTFGLLFTETFSIPFYIVYLLTGITDALDGFLARKLKVTGDFGAKLDSVADTLFYIMMIIKISSTLIEILPLFVWILVGVIVLLRIASYVASAVKFRKMASLHTYLNKTCGFLVFTVPFFIRTKIGVPLCVIICILGIIAASEDFIIHIRKDEYSTDVKTIIS